MGINPHAIGNTSVTNQSVPLVIEMLYEQPVTSATFTPARPAGQLCGFYNGITGFVELYVVNSSGIRFVRVA